MSPPAATPPISPAPPPDRGPFGALWVTPLATHRFQGAGLEAGYHFGWFAGLYRIGVLQNGYAPPADLSPVFTLERMQRLFLDLELDGQWRYRGVLTLAVGAGAVLIHDRVDIASMNGLTWTTVTDERGRIRPLVNVTLAGPLFEVSTTFYVGSNPEGRLSLAVCWGRYARR